MMKNEMKTNNKTVLLAIVAVFAMIAAGAAVVMASDGVEAAPATEDNLATFTSGSAVAAGAKYYVNDDVTNATAFSGTGVVTLYVEPKSTGDITINVKPITACKLNILIVTSSTAGTTSGKKVTYDAASISYTSNVNDAATNYKVTKDGAISTTDAGSAAVFGAKLVTEAGVTTVFAVGATISVNFADEANDVLTINEISGTINKMSAIPAPPAEPEVVSSITLKDLKTTSAGNYFTITGSDTPGDMPTVAAGAVATATGSMTVTKGTFNAAASMGNGIKTVLNAVATKDLTAVGAGVIAASQTEASATYLFAYGTADLKFKFSDATPAEKTINLVNSTATISMFVEKSDHTGVFATVIETTNIDGTMVAAVNATPAFTSLTLNAAPVAGAASSSVKVGATTGVLTLGTAVAYDLIVDKDANVTTALAAISGKVSIKTDGALALTYAGVVAISNDVEIRGTLDIAAGTNATVTNKSVSLYGTLDGHNVETSVLTINADATKSASFKAYSGSTIANDVKIAKGAGTGTITIDTSGAISTAYLKGTVSSSQAFSQSQNVVVDGDLEIVNSAVITVLGGFTVMDGVTMTIAKGAVNISSSAADVVIDGKVVIDSENSTFSVAADAKSVKINGTVSNSGNLSFATTDVTIASGGIVTVETDAVASTFTNVTVASGGVLNVKGAAQLTSVINKGEVVLNGAILSAGTATIYMAAAGATVDVLSYTLAADSAYTLVIDDSKMKDSGYEAQNVSVVTIDANNLAKVGMGGMFFTESKELKTVNNVKKAYYTLTVSGSAAAVDLRENKVPAFAGTVDINTAGGKHADVRLADEFTIAAGVTLTITDKLTVDKTLYLAGTATAQAKIAGVAEDHTESLTVTGTIVYDNYGTVLIPGAAGNPLKVLNAVGFSVGTGIAQLNYLASIADALEILEVIEDDTTLTAYGTEIVIDKSIIVPDYVKIAGTATITIGTAADNTVVMSMEDGASIGSGITVVVLGSLYAENYKDIKTNNITADVKTSDGTEVLYTNLYSAVEAADVGDIVEVTNDIVIFKSFTVKAGVIMNIPGGFTATVDPTSKVTITVNGVLATDSTIAVTGGEWAADGIATDKKAVLAVNGTFMTGESADETGAAVNAVYHVAGAYYYLSDEVGAFVYVGSLADALLTSVKKVYIYETVYEYGAVSVGSGKTVYVQDKAVLNASDISLTKSSIETNGTGALNATVTAAAGADGTAVFSVAKYTGNIADTYNETDKVYSAKITDIVGSVSIMSGIVDINNDNCITGATSVLTVLSDAYLYVPAGKKVTFTDGYQTILGAVFVDGTLDLNNAEKLDIAGQIIVNHDADALTDGKLTVSKQIALTSGSIVIADDVPAANVNFNANVILGNEPDSVGATASVYGKVRLADNAVIIAYPDANVEDLLINPDLEGADHSKATAFVLNDVAYMIVFGTEASTVTYAQALAIPEFDLPAYAANFHDATTWGLTAAGTVGSKLVGEADVVATPIQITVSVVTGLQVFVDGVKYNSGATPLLTIGTHTVQVMVNPGYKMADGSTPSVTFAGKAVTGIMAITVTSDMVNPVLSVIGDVVVDQPDIPEQEKKDDSMIMILLGVLVVMVVILAIVTVIRMMRS